MSSEVPNLKTFIHDEQMMEVGLNWQAKMVCTCKLSYKKHQKTLKGRNDRYSLIVIRLLHVNPDIYNTE